MYPELHPRCSYIYLQIFDCPIDYCAILSIFVSLYFFDFFYHNYFWKWIGGQIVNRYLRYLLHLFIAIFLSFSQTRLIIFLVGFFLHFSWNDLKLCFERYQQHHKKVVKTVYFRCFSFFLVFRRSNYFLNHQVSKFFYWIHEKKKSLPAIWRFGHK